MPHYYFHCDGDDTEGLELPDDAAARREGQAEVAAPPNKCRMFHNLLLCEAAGPHTTLRANASTLSNWGGCLAEVLELNLSLIRLDTCLLHYRAPASGLIAHKRAEVFRAAALQIRALITQVLAYVGHVEDFDQFRVQPLHDRHRRAARDHHPIPECDIDARITNLRE